MRGSWRPNRTATYWSPLYCPKPRFFPVLLGCSTVGPASLGHVPQSSIFSQLIWYPNWLIRGLRAPSAGCWLSLPHLISNWLNFLCTVLYNCSTSTFFLWASQIAHIQPIHGQGYTQLFLDRMHLLFTQVHFLFWQLGRVGGQYTTTYLFIIIIWLIWEFFTPADGLSLESEWQQVSLSHQDSS